MIIYHDVFVRQNTSWLGYSTSIQPGENSNIAVFTVNVLLIWYSKIPRLWCSIGRSPVHHYITMISILMFRTEMCHHSIWFLPSCGEHRPARSLFIFSIPSVGSEFKHSFANISHFFISSTNSYSTLSQCWGNYMRLSIRCFPNLSHLRLPLQRRLRRWPSPQPALGLPKSYRDRRAGWAV